MYIVQYRKHKTEKNNNVKNWNKERNDCVKTQLIINKWLHTEKNFLTYFNVALIL